MKTLCLVLAVALTGTFADVSHLSGIQTVLHEDGYHYDKPKVPFPPPPSVDKKEEYLPPPPAPQPLCNNGAPDSSYPDCCQNGGRGAYCCANGANNEYCCQGPYVNPTCSAPPTTTPRYVPPQTTSRYVPPPPPPPPQPLCENRAPDSTYPYCCSNGARNEFCCNGPWVNPTCSAPTTTPRPTTTTRYVPPPPPPPPQPLCDNGAPDSSYPDCCVNGGRGAYCCANGANNEYCCQGPYVNPTCSAPTTTTRYIPPTTTPRYVPLCANGAPDSAYPDCCTNGGRGAYCCANGANNEYCCQGPYVNPTCSAPTTQAPIYLPPETTTRRFVPPPPPPPPKPLCDNGAPNSAYPDCCTNGGRGAYCCANGANNEYCCQGPYVNPTCSAPPTTTPRYVPPQTTSRYVPPPPPPPPQPLCENRAPDSTYPYCCSNGARNEFCCNGPWVNPTCSAPPPPPPPPKVEVNENYLPPCGNGGVGPNCDTSNGYNYDRPAVAFRY